MPWPDDDGPYLPSSEISLYWNNRPKEGIGQRLEERKPWLFSGKRFYCPTCGGVYEGWDSPIQGGWVVCPHAKCYTDPDSSHDYDFRQCAGGVVDPVKDRAP